MSALIFRMYSKSCDLFSGWLSPFTLRDIILISAILEFGFGAGILGCSLQYKNKRKSHMVGNI